MTKKKVQNAKINNLQVIPKGGNIININESSKLLHEIENNQITYKEALERIKNIRSDINKINQANFQNILFMVNEIFTGKSERVEVNKEDKIRSF